MINSDASNCHKCERLANFLEEVKRDNPDSFCRPVPSFGEPDAGLLIVGLAPGMHGANATGRPFTGDYAGELLYQTLYKYGFSTAAQSLSADDGLQLLNCRITNAVRCLPPQNKPVGAEVNNCNQFLALELAALPADGVVIALGTIAHKAVIRALGKKQTEFPFAHAACHELEAGKHLLDSYHCSRYNTQTKRLTTEMFEDVFRITKELLGH